VDELDGGGEPDMAWPAYPPIRAAASVNNGRRRLPPESIRWRATSGIRATTLPSRSWISASVARMSAETRASSRSTGETPESTDAFLRSSGASMGHPQFGLAGYTRRLGLGRPIKRGQAGSAMVTPFCGLENACAPS